MARLLISLILFCGSLVAADVRAQEASPAPRPKNEVVPGNLYIKFTKKAGVTLEALQQHATGIASVDELLNRYGVYQVEEFDPLAKTFEVCRRHGIDRTYVLYFQTEYDALGVARTFKTLPSVESAAPRFVHIPCYLPNDKFFNSQAPLQKNRMNLVDAWNSHKGDSNTVIAVTDFGVNYNHEDLASQLYINPGESGLDNNGNDKRTNNKDDDGDGKRDNWRGWDHAGNTPQGSPKPDNDPMPEGPSNSHGTLVTGSAAAKADNGKGIAGSGFHCRYMPIKTGNASDLYMGYDGIHYAATKGADIIVCSWANDSVNFIEFIDFFSSIIASATDLGSLIVASAGNAATDNDIFPYYPAVFDRVLSVGGTRKDNDQAWSATCFGNTVDVFAPAESVLTTDLPESDAYDVVSGTSFSAPLTGGVAGILASKYPEWTPALIARQLVVTCDNVVNPAKRNKYWGRVNAYRAVTEPTYPGVKITTFSVDGVEGGELLYINKKYTLDVTFKNVVTPGPVNVVLLNGEYYNVSQASASLGTMNTDAEKTGRFVFERDPANYFEPGLEPMKLLFYATDGNKYKDTLALYVTVVDDAEWVEQSVSPVAGDGLLVENWPNPASAATTVRLTLREQDRVRVSLRDMLGREVLATAEQVYGAGMHDVQLDVQELPAGLYSYVVESRSGMRIVRQLVVSR